MRWLWAVCLAVAVLSQVEAKPSVLHSEEAGEVEAEIMTELLNKLLIPSEREAREMTDADDEMETDEKMDSDMAEAEDGGDAKALDDSEAMREAKQMEVARFNNYIDAIYRRMNAALKAKLMDPMELNLDEKVKKTPEDKKKSGKKSRVLRQVEEEDEDENEDGEETEVAVDRLGKAAKKGGNKKNGKKGKGKSKDERQAEKQRKKDLKKKKKDGKGKNAQAKNKRKNKKSQRESRSGHKNKKNVNNKNKNKNKKDSKKKGNGKGKNARKNNNAKSKKGRKDSDGKGEKMVGSLSGIASMERKGDVKVMDEENHKVVTSEFSVGPLQLQVSKIYGRGKARTVKTARAITEVMSGTLVLKVKPDGTAHVKKVVFKKPENVEVKGKLSDSQPRSLTSMRNSVNKMRPLAAMKILKTARYVLKSPAAYKQ